eukprot:Gregarina_sp_Poly_1__4114@NODE_2257_length_2396_cov_82_855303_g1448_i0_p3_GENE_NODE_2257_length_2396_cov_82_855303_g1448_i0NODE_2257_length_2396_cov_82_855303_g1448_i0_p3_ORF_typecomplete_len113_score6_66_NODE_2257_length_2396_cov_82_855303_g1448_i012991637
MPPKTVRNVPLVAAEWYIRGGTRREVSGIPSVQSLSSKFSKYTLLLNPAQFSYSGVLSSLPLSPNPPNSNRALSPTGDKDAPNRPEGKSPPASTFSQVHFFVSTRIKSEMYR